MYSSFTRVSFHLLLMLLCVQQSCLNSEATSEGAALSFPSSSEEVESYDSYKPEVQVQPVKSLSAAEYKTWVRQNLFVQKKIGALEYEVLYQPQEFIFLQQHPETATRPTPSAALETEDDFQYFLLTITHTAGEDLLKGGAADQALYQERLRYYSFEMQQDIRLLDGADTLSCKMFHFERTYGLAPYGKFVLAFEKAKQPVTHKTFILHDQLNGNGIVKLRFDKALLSQIPTLNYE